MPPKFLLTPNEQISKDTPRSYRNQLIPETASDLLPKIIADASSFNYNTDPSYDEVKVIKVFEPTDPPKAGSSLALSTEFEQNKPPTISHCMAISVGKTHRNMPLPEEVGNGILTDLKSITLTKMSMYCFDASGVLKQPLKLGDKLPVHKISASEARITGIPTGNNVVQAEADEISAKKAATGADGGNVGDSKPIKTTGGKKDDSSFATCKSPTYPNLPKKPTTFISYTKEQVIGAFNKISNDKVLKSMAFAILSMEQGNFSFPNNNVSGIQLDFGKNKGFANTTESDFDYQTCFRDNGGDQRIFAGFDTLEKGLQSFIKIIQGKINIGAFKTPTGTLEQQSSIMADNYYSSWNIAATPNELQLLKTQGYFIRNGTRVERGYNKTKQIFYNTLGVFN
jgi:hypothetical protein